MVLPKCGKIIGWIHKWQHLFDGNQVSLVKEKVRCGPCSGNTPPAQLCRVADGRASLLATAVCAAQETHSTLEIENAVVLLSTSCFPLLAWTVLSLLM